MPVIIDGNIIFIISNIFSIVYKTPLPQLLSAFLISCIYCMGYRYTPSEMQCISFNSSAARNVPIPPISFIHLLRHQALCRAIDTAALPPPGSISRSLQHVEESKLPVLSVPLLFL